MIVKESDIRKKIRRLLSEEDEPSFKYYDASDRERTTTAPREGHVVDLTNNPISSNILHKLTDGSSKSYIAWKIVFEKLFIKNNGAEDKNVKNINYFFADVKWRDVYYSIKSTLSSDRTAGSFQNMAYSGNPTFTESFIKSCADGDNSTRKWGIIVASKIGNDLIWQTIGEPTLGSVIYDRWLAIKDSAEAEAFKINAALKKGKNTGDVIKYFFGERKDDVFKILLAPPALKKNSNADNVLKTIYDMLDQLEYEIETNPQINSKVNDVEESISKLIVFIRDNNQGST